jgi:hypothetical protein
MITCWFCQRIVSIRLDANSALPEWVRNHIQRCPACRESYESATALIQQLSTTAKDQNRVASPFLHGRIMSAVRSLENVQVDAQRGRSRLGWGMAVGMVCLVATSMVWLRLPFQPDQSAPKSTASSAEPALNVKLPSVAQVDQWTKTLDAPLEQETKLVLRDATAAINTLARGFLPEDLLASSTEAAQH